MSTTIPNFKEVCPGIYRGGQPETREDWDYLVKLGINNILKLNEESEETDQPARDLGIEVVELPISLAEQFLGPTDAEIKSAIADIEPGTFIHCEHGQDRTGLIVGIYRVQVQGWTKDAAYAEMKANGFHPELIGLDWYWREKVTVDTTT